MVLTASARGNLVECVDGTNWRYADGEPFDDSRPCLYCGRMPTAEGCDACIGHIPGAIAACCGHGDPSRSYVMWPDGTVQNPLPATLRHDSHERRPSARPKPLLVSVEDRLRARGDRAVLSRLRRMRRVSLSV